MGLTSHSLDFTGQFEFAVKESFSTLIPRSGVKVFFLFGLRSARLFGVYFGRSGFLLGILQFVTGLLIAVFGLRG